MPTPHDTTSHRRSERRASAHPGTTFVDAGGVVLHAHLTPAAPDGARTPPLLLLHSLGTELRIWDGVVARLPRFAHLRFDLRGHGLSEVPAGPYAVAEMADDGAAVARAFGIGRFVAVGISVGGQVALRLAIDHPALVAAVVALDTGAAIGTAAGWDERIATVREGGVEALADAVVARWFPHGPPAHAPHALRGYRTLLVRTPRAGYLATCAALRDEDLTSDLVAVRVPVLGICGSDDRATPPELVRTLVEAVPRGRYVEIGGAGHLPCLDRPDDVAAAIGAFIDELAEDGG